MKTLHVLNDAYLAGNKRCLCGDEVAIADFFSIANVILGERIGVNLADYPNVERWVNNLKERSSWPVANSAYNKFAASRQNNQFEGLSGSINRISCEVKVPRGQLKFHDL